jgi:predicted unusual protein kinase regulating ubiquinone biosynthesis (AarF/ABC1/UbiB family)
MTGTRTRPRYRRILRFFGGVILSEVWWELLLPRIGMRGASRRTRSRRLKRSAARFRALAAAMGGVLIKVGQFFSARLDVLPREITGELAGLQDEVGAESFEDIREVVEAELGGPLGKSFAEFDPVPIASASIGQVHRARVFAAAADGTPSPCVVVKVQRPQIHRLVDADMAALRVVGRWLSRFAFIRRRANVQGLIDEFYRDLLEEMDYLHEGTNAERFAENFKGRADVAVPRVIWSRTTQRVLTLEEMQGIKITDYAAIEAAGIDRKEAAERLLDVYLKQVFLDGFFHADPHPGNLFVLPGSAPGDPGAWRLVFVDFGMAGTLTPGAFAGLREALISVATRDATRLVSAYRRLGILLPGADVDLIERANRSAFERVWGKSTKDIMAMSLSEAGALAEEFGEILYEMPFQVPQNLILLGRCVSILSGIAMGLDPDFNVWNGLAPYAKRLVEADDGAGPALAWKEIKAFIGFLASLPGRAESLMSRIEQGRTEIKLPEMKQHVTKLEHSVRKLAGSIVFAALLVCGTAFYLTGNARPASACAAAGGCLLLWILFGK